MIFMTLTSILHTFHLCSLRRGPLQSLSRCLKSTSEALRSVFDWSEMMDASAAWAGREWYVVRKAEVRLAED